MLKIVHIFTGVTALLLSFIPSLNQESLPYLQQPEALYLAFLGFINLLQAPTSALRGGRAQALVSVLLVFAVAVQALVLLAPLVQIGNHPAVLLSLLPLALASALHLAINLPQRLAAPHQAAPAPVATTTSIEQSGRESGTVKWFNTSKGFGFISRDSGDDIFVHFRAIRGEGHRVLVEGQRVEFSVINRDKGLQAEDVIAAPPGR